MDTLWETLQKGLSTLFDFMLFLLVSAVFLPSFLVVTYLQDYWAKKLGEFFGL